MVSRSSCIPLLTDIIDSRRLGLTDTCHEYPVQPGAAPAARVVSAAHFTLVITTFAVILQGRQPAAGAACARAPGWNGQNHLPPLTPALRPCPIAGIGITGMLTVSLGLATAAAIAGRC